MKKTLTGALLATVLMAIPAATVYAAEYDDFLVALNTTPATNYDTFNSNSSLTNPNLTNTAGMGIGMGTGATTGPPTDIGTAAGTATGAGINAAGTGTTGTTTGIGSAGTTGTGTTTGVGAAGTTGAGTTTGVGAAGTTGTGAGMTNYMNDMNNIGYPNEATRTAVPYDTNHTGRAYYDTNNNNNMTPAYQNSYQGQRYGQGQANAPYGYNADYNMGNNHMNNSNLSIPMPSMDNAYGNGQLRVNPDTYIVQDGNDLWLFMGSIKAKLDILVYTNPQHANNEQQMQQQMQQPQATNQQQMQHQNNNMYQDKNSLAIPVLR